MRMADRSNTGKNVAIRRGASPVALRPSKRRPAWRVARRGAACGALCGAISGLLAPVTHGIAGFTLIALPPVALRCAPGLCLATVGALEWALAGFAVGFFIAALRASRHVNP